ncbi:MAG: hypothetical protein PHE09_11140 [Oscillospiraceae bacterium]|nr:hypothetical protein [Oscillospiraceae bacterium]
MSLVRMGFDKKYEDVIASVATKNEVDMHVASDMLISSIRGRNGETYTAPNGELKFDIYPGIPEDFDWEEATKDYHTLIEKL